jgi:uncharacterized protein (TIGR02217 family)
MPTASFLNIRLPVDIERNFRGGPGYRTTKKESKGGVEKRNQDWDQQRARYTLGYGHDDRVVFEGILALFNVVIGSLHSFLFKDWIDNKVPRQIIGATDGSTATFQLKKTYTVMTVDPVPVAKTKDRTIVRPTIGQTLVWVNAVPIVEGPGADEFAIDPLTGIITLGATLAAQSGTDVEAQCDEFFVVVRFEDDEFDVELVWEDVGFVPDFRLVEVKGE